MIPQEGKTALTRLPRAEPRELDLLFLNEAIRQATLTMSDASVSNKTNSFENRVYQRESCARSKRRGKGSPNKATREIMEFARHVR